MTKKGMIKEFLERCYNNKTTIESRIRILTEFFKAIERDPETYFLRKRDLKEYENDIQKYANHICSPREDDRRGRGVMIKLKPKTFHNYMASVKMMYEDKGIELRRHFWKSLRIRHKMNINRAATKDFPPTKEQLRQLLSWAPLKTRAKTLFLLSTGCRVTECLNVLITDIDLDSKPASAYLKDTKTGQPRTVYMSDECRDTVKEWLKERDNYLRLAKARTNFTHTKVTRKLEDPRLFPFSIKMAGYNWNLLLQKTKLDTKDRSTGIRVMHLGTLRKYFRSKMPSTIGIDMTEELMGHEGYLTDAYRRHTDKELAEAYRKGQGAVMVYGDSTDLSEVNEKIREKDEQLVHMKGLFEIMQHQVSAVEQEMGNVRKLMGDLDEAKERTMKRIMKVTKTP